MSEITPAKLDEIATKLLGWTKFMDGVFKRDPDDTEYCGRLSPADAMLVLEAMGKWCRENDKRIEINCPAYNIGFSQTKPANVSVHLWEVSPSRMGAVTIFHESADTPAAAIFQCAAQLVERM